MNIHALVIPNEEIKKRAGFTGADWWFDEQNDLQVRIASEIKKKEWQEALMIHETFEAMIARLLGITVKQIDDFDREYEKNPDCYNHGLDAGDAPGCPYSVPHSLAVAPERIYAAMVPGFCWEEYDLEISKI
jgi:hypothetical protein